jgi:hypothetical protein
MDHGYAMGSASSGKMTMPAVARDLSPIEVALERLNKRQIELQDVTCRLAERLGPVLRVTVCEDGVAESPANSPLESPLASRLGSLDARLLGSQRQLLGMLETLEL